MQARRLQSTARWIAAAGIGLGLLAGGAAPAAASGCGQIMVNGQKIDLPCVYSYAAYNPNPPPCYCPPELQVDDRLSQVVMTQPQASTNLGTQVGGLAR